MFPGLVQKLQQDSDALNTFNMTGELNQPAQSATKWRNGSFTNNTWVTSRKCSGPCNTDLLPSTLCPTGWPTTAPSHATMPVTWDDAAIPSASSDAPWDEAAVRRRTVKQLVGSRERRGKEDEEGWTRKLQEKLRWTISQMLLVFASHEGFRAST